jgi:hypothetical protein
MSRDNLFVTVLVGASLLSMVLLGGRKRHAGQSFKLDGLCIQARLDRLCRHGAVGQDIWHKGEVSVETP